MGVCIGPAIGGLLFAVSLSLVVVSRAGFSNTSHLTFSHSWFIFCYVTSVYLNRWFLMYVSRYSSGMQCYPLFFTHFRENMYHMCSSSVGRLQYPVLRGRGIPVASSAHQHLRHAGHSRSANLRHRVVILHISLRGVVLKFSITQFYNPTKRAVMDCLWTLSGVHGHFRKKYENR